MTMTALVSIDDEPVESGTLLAFIGESVRGMQTVPQLASFGPFGGYYLFEMIIYGNVGGVTQPWSCLSSVYFHATATARVSLSDGSSIDVTRQSSLATSSSDVVYLSSSSSTRMQARSAGTATISA